MRLLYTDHYVYTHEDADGVFYVGCGTGRRMMEQSKRNPMWRERVARSSNKYTVTIVHISANRDECEEVERKLIAELLPACNCQGTRPRRSIVGKWTPESNAKRSASMRGNKNGAGVQRSKVAMRYGADD